MYRRLNSPVSGSRMDWPRRVSRRRTFAQRQRELLGDGHGEAHLPVAQAALGGHAPAGTAKVNSPSVSPWAASGTQTNDGGGGLTEVRADRARARVVDPVDAARGEAPSSRRAGTARARPRAAGPRPRPPRGRPVRRASPETAPEASGKRRPQS